MGARVPGHGTLCILQGGSAVLKNLPTNAGDADPDSIPRFGGFTGEENGNPLQYSC